MPTLEEIMGKEAYDLIYTHFDSDGNKISDPDEYIYCEDEDIDKERVKKLKALIGSVNNHKTLGVSIEAAKLLTSWGIEEGIHFIEKSLDERIEKYGNFNPDRLYGYDVTYEQFEGAVDNYYARLADRGEADKAFKRIKPIITKIIQLSAEIPHRLLNLCMQINCKRWEAYQAPLKTTFESILKKEEQSRNDYWNIIDLKVLFLEWDPKYLNELESQYGTIEVPENR